MIGAISGYAVAGGLELALLCDIRILEETAIMGVFCRRFGVPLIGRPLLGLGVNLEHSGPEFLGDAL